MFLDNPPNSLPNFKEELAPFIRLELGRINKLPVNSLKKYAQFAQYPTYKCLLLFAFSKFSVRN